MNKKKGGQGRAFFCLLLVAPLEQWGVAKWDLAQVTNPYLKIITANFKLKPFSNLPGHRIYIYICIYLSIYLYLSLSLSLSIYIYILATYIRHCPANVNQKHYKSHSNFGLVGPNNLLWAWLIPNRAHYRTHMQFLMLIQLLGLHMPNFSLIGS